MPASVCMFAAKLRIFANEISILGRGIGFYVNGQHELLARLHNLEAPAAGFTLNRHAIIAQCFGQSAVFGEQFGRHFVSEFGVHA